MAGAGTGAGAGQGGGTNIILDIASGRRSLGFGSIVKIIREIGFGDL
jgi:hypothetical protein